MTSSPHETLADGSPIPDYLTQTPRTPFTVGKIQTLGNIIYGYSGIVNFDITAAASYPLLRFTLERNAMIRATFNADWNLLDATDTDAGVQVAIDGTNVILVTWETGNAMGSGRTSPWYGEFLLPAGRDCNIVVLNPDADATLLQANLNIVGQFISNAGAYHV
jgi:hypothetical protein